MSLRPIGRGAGFLSAEQVYQAYLLLHILTIKDVCSFQFKDVRIRLYIWLCDGHKVIHLAICIFYYNLQDCFFRVPYSENLEKNLKFKGNLHITFLPLY